MSFKYIEIKNWKDSGVLRRICVTNKTQRSIEKVEEGININLNQDDFYTINYESEVELDVI